MMKKLNEKALFLKGFVFFLSTQAVFAQEKVNNNNIWLHYFGKNIVADKWSISFETSMRYANGFSEKQQYFFRPTIDYQFTKNLTGSVGFTHYNTYAYGNPAMNSINTPENNFFIQGAYTHSGGELKISHRLREEFRYVGLPSKGLDGKLKINDYEYRNRFRYMLMFTYPLLKKEKETKVFALLGNEIFLNLGKKSGKTLLNQNRVIAGLGYNFNKNHQFQLSYVHQNIWNKPNTLLENNPTLRLTYTTNFDFTK